MREPLKLFFCISDEHGVRVDVPAIPYEFVCMDPQVSAEDLARLSDTLGGCRMATPAELTEVSECWLPVQAVSLPRIS